MSSFICSSEHFNSCQAAVAELAISRDGIQSMVWEMRDRFPAISGRRPDQERAIKAEVENVFDNLRQLSVLCVSLQYKHHYEGTLDREIQECTDDLMKNRQKRKPLTKIGLIKALQCISYQIEIQHLKELRELTADERRALDFLDIFVPNLALDIIQRGEQYDREAWEIH